MSTVVVERAKEHKGKCFECDKPIKIGDKYLFFNGKRIHKHCMLSRQVNDIYVARNGVCLKCHLELPPSGECCE